MNYGELISGLLVIALLMASGALWLVAIPRVRNGQTLLPYEPRRSVPWGALELFPFFLLVMMLVVSILTTIVMALTGGSETPLPNQSPESQATIAFVVALIEIGFVFAWLYVVVLKNSATWQDIGIDISRLSADLRLGVRAFILLAGPVFLIQFLLTLVWPSQHPIIEFVLKNPSVKFFAVSTLSAVIVAPIAEEFVFRVLFQGWLEKFQSSAATSESLLVGRLPTSIRGGLDKSIQREDSIVEHDTDEFAQRVNDDNPYSSPQTITKSTEETALDPAEEIKPQAWPIFVSASVFALMHLGHGPDPVPLFVLAAGLGYIYQQTHRIIPCIVVHFLLNSFSMTLLIMQAYFGAK